MFKEVELLHHRHQALYEAMHCHLVSMMDNCAHRMVFKKFIFYLCATHWFPNIMDCTDMLDLNALPCSVHRSADAVCLCVLNFMDVRTDTEYFCGHCEPPCKAEPTSEMCYAADGFMVPLS